MGDEYIKKEDAIKAFDPKHRQDWYTPWIVETLEDLPSADVAPVRHGRWKEHKGYCECDQCECLVTSDFKYCPNCGARMDGESDE